MQQYRHIFISIFTTIFLGVFVVLSGIVPLPYFHTPQAAACTTISSGPTLGYSCTSSGPAITVSFPAVSGASQYVVDWWFTDPTKSGYQECQKTISGTSTTISPSDNTTARKMTSTTVECFSTAYSYTYGVAYKAFTSSCTTAYSPAQTYAPNPQSNLTLSRTYGSNPSITATMQALSGTSQYYVDWWFKNSSGVYNECNSVTSSTSFKITPGGNYTKAVGSSCYPDADTENVGMAYKSHSPCNGVYSNPASTTGIVSTPTPTPSPTPPGPAVPTATPTPSPSPIHTYLNVALQLPGIGVGGNLSPLHPTRDLHVSIYAAGVDPSQPNVSPIFDNTSESIQYNSNNGYFINSKIDVGTLATGNYQILFKSTGYLRKQAIDPNASDNTIAITGGTTNIVPLTKLIAGDVTPIYNVMDASDFYAIAACYGSKATTSSCTAGSQITDINDDGVVNGIDLNYWLLGMQTLLNNNDPLGNGDGVTGN